MFRFRRILVAHDPGAGGDRALERAQQLAGQWHVPVQVVESMAADAILEAAARERCDLVVTGEAVDLPADASRGVVQALVDRSPVSTLVARRQVRGAYRRVLVGTDLTPESRHGLEAAAALFPLADITLLHALDIPYESLWLSSSRSADLLRMERETIAEFAAAAGLDPELRRRLQLVVEHAHPEAALRERALADDDELVVIGAHRRGLASRILVGGTTRRIVRSASADVLVVRAPPAE